MFALHPYSVVTSCAGDSTMASPTITSSTLSPKISFIFLQRGSNAAFFSSNTFFSRCMFADFNSLLGDVDKLLSIVLLQLLRSVLVNWVDHEKDFNVLLLEGFHEGRVFNDCLVFSSDVVNHFLVLVHSF